MTLASAAELSVQHLLSVADLTAASLLAPLVRPPGTIWAEIGAAPAAVEAFFEPLASTSPRSGTPPRITNRSTPQASPADGSRASMTRSIPARGSAKGTGATRAISTPTPSLSTCRLEAMGVSMPRAI